MLGHLRLRILYAIETGGPAETRDFNTTSGTKPRWRGLNFASIARLKLISLAGEACLKNQPRQLPNEPRWRGLSVASIARFKLISLASLARLKRCENHSFQIRFHLATLIGGVPHMFFLCSWSTSAPPPSNDVKNPRAAPPFGRPPAGAAPSRSPSARSAADDLAPGAGGCAPRS